MRIILIILLSLPIYAYTQKIPNNPYTRYGIGELNTTSIAAYRSMGNTGIANLDRFHMNMTNPASYSVLGSTAYEVGAFAKLSTLSEKSKEQVVNTKSSWSGNLDYLGLAFPLKNPLNEVYETNTKPYRLGMGFHLSRHSVQNYNIQGEDSLAGIGKFNRLYRGFGGTYQFSWGNAILYKNFSFGLDLGYLFGTLNNNSTLEFEDLLYSFSPQSDRSYHIKSFRPRLGLLYNFTLNQKQLESDNNAPAKILRIGLTFNPASTIYSSKDEKVVSVQKLGSILTIDTLIALENKAGKGRLPSEIGLGFMYLHGEKSAITGEFKMSNWSKYFNEANGDNEGSMNNALRVALGGYYRPDYKSYTSFLKRSFFKYGFYYEKDYRKIANADINAYGFTTGIGLPFSFQRKFAHADIGIDIGSRGKGTIISENYFKINFGFTFNDDEWFIKRKYN